MTKTVRISQQAFETISATGDPLIPFSAKLDRMLAQTSTKSSKPKPNKSQPTLVSKLGCLFKEEHLKNFGYEYPEWGPKENSQLKQWLKRVTEEQAIWAIKTYFGWTDRFAVKSGHSLSILVTRYVEMVSDYKRPVQKQKMFKQHEKVKSEVYFDEFRTREQGTGDLRITSKSSEQLPNKTSGRVPKLDSDPFAPERAFADPSDPFNDPGSI